jgi:hypothetical protein
MVRLRSVVRDLVLVCVAVAVGWWCRGAGTPVLAQRSGSSSSARGSGNEENLAFQLVGAGPQASLTVYNPENKTLYVYSGIGAGSSYINCEVSFTVANPGAPIQRRNCPVGDLLPQR